MQLLNPKAYIHAIKLRLLKSPMLAKWIPFSKPGNLVLSFPRSGSSWIGAILSQSPDAAYLREPVNAAFNLKYTNPVINIEEDEQAYNRYHRYASMALSGVLPDGYWQVRDLKQFSFFRRKERRVLIKEVNTHALQYYCKHHDLKIIYVIRNPLGIADSLTRLGWTNKGKWRQFGNTFGKNLNIATTLSESNPVRIVRYEELATEPEKAFEEIFEFFAIRKPENYKELIEKYCYSGKKPSNPFANSRDSSTQIHKWRENLDSSIIEEIEAGYKESDLEASRRTAFNYFDENGDLVK